MARSVLFATMGTLGSMQPCRLLAFRLQSLGHQTTTACAPSGHPPEGGVFALTEQEAVGFAIAGWPAASSMVRQAFATFRAMRHARPDVIVTDSFALGVIVAARAAGVPVVVLGLGAYLWPRSGTHAPERLDHVRQERRAHAIRSSADAARALGLKPFDRLVDEQALLGDAFMLRSAPELEDCAGPLPEQVVFVGAALASQGPCEPQLARHVFVQADKLFCAKDPLPEVFRTLVEEGVPTLASLGGLADRYPDLGPGVRTRPHAPLPHAVQGARLTINTGHTTSTLASLAAGVPVLVLDHGSGAEELAHRCQCIGAGTSIRPADCAPGEVAAWVRAGLSDERLQQGAQRAATALAAIDSWEVMTEVTLSAADRRAPNKSAPKHVAAA